MTPSQILEHPPLVLGQPAREAFFRDGYAPAPTSHTGDVVRGEPARWAHMEVFDGRMPPRWEKVGYGSIFTAQRGEAAAPAP